MRPTSAAKDTVNTGRRAEGQNVPVIGIAQRHGKVTAKVVTNVKRSTVMPLIAKNVQGKPLSIQTNIPSTMALRCGI